MYLFTRNVRLVGGNGTAGIEWATKITTKVTQVTGQEVQLWAASFSPGFGRITWTAWVDDLTVLETVSDKLQVEPSFTDLQNQGTKFTDGQVDDTIYQPVFGQPNPSRAGSVRRRRPRRRGRRELRTRPWGGRGDRQDG